MIIETFGGIGRCAEAKLRSNARIANAGGKQRRIDRSKHGRYSRDKSYLELHIRRISTAAVVAAATATLDRIVTRTLHSMPDSSPDSA